MAVINVPDEQKHISDESAIRDYLRERSIFYDHWKPVASLAKDADEQSVLSAFESQLTELMAKKDYKSADVVSIFSDTPNMSAIRSKFLAEHTHTEDEVRYFVEGQGLFWFNLEGKYPVFSVLCQKGDIISVPAGVRHWFDLGPEPYVRAIRIFSDESGWVAHYTGSKIAERYNPSYA